MMAESKPDYYLLNSSQQIKGGLVLISDSRSACAMKNSLFKLSLQTDFTGWIFNAVKCDRINIILVDFLNRICLNIPLCVEALFSLLHL